MDNSNSKTNFAQSNILPVAIIFGSAFLIYMLVKGTKK